jgi:hypothetical protein
VYISFQSTGWISTVFCTLQSGGGCYWSQSGTVLVLFSLHLYYFQPSDWSDFGVYNCVKTNNATTGLQIVYTSFYLWCSYFRVFFKQTTKIDALENKSIYSIWKLNYKNELLRPWRFAYYVHSLHMTLCLHTGKHRTYLRCLQLHIHAHVVHNTMFCLHTHMHAHAHAHAHAQRNVHNVTACAFLSGFRFLFIHAGFCI